MNNFVLRFLSALILAPTFLYIIYINNYSLIIFLSIIYILSVYELKFLLKNYKIYYLVLILFIALALICLIKLRGDSDKDFFYLLWIITIVWMSDIGGYIVGKGIKGPKLSKFSPNKTISGFFGSIIFSQLSILIINKYYDLMTLSLLVFMFQFFLCLISIFGDLFFSFIKRKNFIKDYSIIVPGHGGVLDRIDGLLFVLFFSYMLKFFYEI